MWTPALALLLSGQMAGAPHPPAPPTPAASPAAELPVSVYQARRERVMKEIGGCVAVLGAQGESGITRGPASGVPRSPCSG